MARTWISWSSGKDSAWVLERLLDDDSIEPCGLLTTVEMPANRVPFQGVGRELLELQAAATGLPLEIVELPERPDNATWKVRMGAAFDRARAAGVESVAFGDLHLGDLRAWREDALAPHGLTARFPLWGEDPAHLAREMIEGGLKASITCVDPAVLDPAWLGCPWDHEFLARCPASLDPCGENGEFHTFVLGGPMLHDEFEVGFLDPVVERERFRSVEPVLRFPLDGTLDLHGIPPAEVGALVDDWIDACAREGLSQLRIVHGKGIGVLRETVHARLRRRDDLAGFEPGGSGGGGWGATIVHLRPRSR